MSGTPGHLHQYRPQLRSISCVGFDWRAEVSLKETLALLQGRTLDQWQYSSEPNADVLVYESQNVLAQAIVRRSAASNDARICFPSASDDANTLTLRAPFGASRLLHCLNHASQQLAGRVTGNITTALPLAQRLDAAIRTPGTIAIAITVGEQRGVLTPADGRLNWPVTMSIDAIASVLGGDVELQIINSNLAHKLPALLTQAPIVLPAEALLWAIGMLRSGHTPLRRLEPNRAYRLRRWPDFGVLGRRATDLRCTSLLMQRPMSIAELAALANVPVGIATNFVNACALCGLLEGSDAIAGSSTASTTPGEKRVSGVLQRIRLAFALN